MNKTTGKVRIGVIGLGNMGSAHTRRILAGEVPRLEVAAIRDADPARLAAFPGVAAFSDSRELIRSGLVDAALIATPHHSHTTIGIDALTRGLHVMVENPSPSTRRTPPGSLRRTRTNRWFSARCSTSAPTRRSEKSGGSREGEPGEIRRINWIITDWFRSHAYYASGGWRATWAHDGGGLVGSHMEVMRDFADAILGGAPLLAPAEKGIHSVELANAMLFSAFRNQPVDLLINAEPYAEHLRGLATRPAREKTVVKG